MKYFKGVHNLNCCNPSCSKTFDNCLNYRCLKLLLNSCKTNPYSVVAELTLVPEMVTSLAAFGAPAILMFAVNACPAVRDSQQS